MNMLSHGPQLQIDIPRLSGSEPMTARGKAIVVIAVAIGIALFVAMGWGASSLWKYSQWGFLLLWAGSIGLSYAGYLWLFSLERPRKWIPDIARCAVIIVLPSVVLLLSTAMFWLTRLAWLSLG